MSLSIYIKKLLGLDFADDYTWLSSEYIPMLENDSFISGTKVLCGINNCNLILQPNANIEIEKTFHGKIIGLGNNIVRIRGEFIGTLSCNKMILITGASFNGNLWSSKIAFIGKTGFILKGNLNSGELILQANFSKKIDFEYLRQLEDYQE